MVVVRVMGTGPDTGPEALQGLTLDHIGVRALKGPSSCHFLPPG